jgi:LacI family transcriptional regulator
MPATIRDVATQARVSVATVSRALSGRRRVSDENLRRVMGAAEELSYRPNLVATALRRQVTNTIGLVLPQISNPFFPTLVESIEWELQSTTRRLLLCDSRGDTAVEQQRLHALLDRQVDGIMISPCDALRSVDAVHSAALQVPLVQIDRRVTGDVTDWVGVDDLLGMRLVAEHLAATGARTAIFVGSLPTNSSALLRLEAFAGESRNFELKTLEPLLGDFAVAWGTKAAHTLLAARRLPDVVVCGNDLIAIGTLRQFVLAGVRVPDQVLVTGFDDIASAELSTPSLTTVRQPHGAIAFEALRLLTKRLDRRDSTYHRISMAPELVVRESTTHVDSLPKRLRRKFPTLDPRANLIVP